MFSKLAMTVLVAFAGLIIVTADTTCPNGAGLYCCEGNPNPYGTTNCTQYTPDTGCGGGRNATCCYYFDSNGGEAYGCTVPTAPNPET